MSLQPLSAFRKSPMSVFDDIPPMNSEPRLLKSSAPMPQTLPQPRMGAEIPEPGMPQQSSFKDKAIGALKGIGTTLFDTGKQVAQQAGVFAKPFSPLGTTMPGLDRLPGAQGAISKVDSMLQPTDAQQGAFDAEQWTELALPFVTGGVGALAKAPSFARRLEEISLRLTPVQKRDLGMKLKGATDWLVTNGITGSPEKRLTMVDDIYDAMESKVSNFFKQHKDTSKYFVNRDDFIQRLHMLKASPTVANSRDYTDLVRQLDGAIDSVKATFRSSKIALPDFNDFKRSIYKAAYNKAGTKISDELEYEIGDAAYEMLEGSLMNSSVTIAGKTLREFNKEYSAAITARKLLKEAVGRNEIGFFGKIMSLALGAGAGTALGGGWGAAAGAAIAPSLASTVAGTAVRSNVGQIAESLRALAPAARKSLASLLLGTGALTASTLESLLNQSDESLPPEETTESSPQSQPPAGMKSLDEFSL